MKRGAKKLVMEITCDENNVPDSIFFRQVQGDDMPTGTMINCIAFALGFIINSAKKSSVGEKELEHIMKCVIKNIELGGEVIKKGMGKSYIGDDADKRMAELEDDEEDENDGLIDNSQRRNIL